MAKIKLTSLKQSEFNTDLTVGGVDYHIQTEAGSEKNPHVMTAAYVKGTIVEAMKTPYPAGGLTGKEDLAQMMKNQHAEMIDRIRAKHTEATGEDRKDRKVYIQELKKTIAKKNWQAAYFTVEEATRMYPEDPVLVSYYGYLRSLVMKERKEGIVTCKQALEMFKKQMPVGGEFYYPMFFLNIGRVYALSGKKDLAVNAYRKGLEYDAENKEIINELKRLGLRRSPPIPFLSRGSFINKFLGKTLTRFRPR